MGVGAFLLPAGAVTFLVTDVEGSSRLWETRPDEMPAAIARYYEILDEAIAAFDGVRPVEQGEGDSVVGAFARAARAARAAVAAQRRLVEEIPWLRVRMALYTGEAQLCDEGNYLGRALNLCARLRACAHGGQIVVSASTAALVADDPSGLMPIDLGVVHLRDLLRPERVAQVVAEGLPVQFPALRAREVAPNNLPAPMTTFIGREQELGDVTALLRTERLVTLTGAGGCGKTRLALHAAAELVEHHRGGTWWVDLAPVVDGADVVDRISTAIGASTPPGIDALTLLIGHVRDLGPVLLVLDNAEHLVDDVARSVEAITAACANCRVLVTSREPLGLPGEVVWRVPSLTAPARGHVVGLDRLGAYESARLFLDRARRVRPNLVLDDVTVAHVMAICSRLDGIPLALELAAARSRTVPLERLAAGLDDAFRMLTGGARTAMPRQQTLLASIAWSVDLLDDPERAVLRRLAVFAGSFDLEASEAVAGDGALVDAYGVLDVLSRLVDKSLVQLDDGTGRYRTLETIRQFCFDRLREARELVSTRDRHAVWFAAWCESLGRGEHDFDIGPIHPTLDDVFAALDWAIESDTTVALRLIAGLGRVWMFIGRYRELDRHLTWLEAIADSHDGVDVPVAVVSLGHAGLALRRAGFEALVERMEERLPEHDRRARRLARVIPATLAALDGSTIEAEQLVKDAVAHGDDDHLVRMMSFTVANTWSMFGDFDRAEAAVNDVIDVVRRHRLPFTVRTAHECVATAILLQRERGQLAEARALATLANAPGGVELFIVAGVVGQLAYAIGDHELHMEAIAWQRPVEVALRTGTQALGYLEFGMLATHCSHALLERRYDDALHHLRHAYDVRLARPAVHSLRLVLLGNRLLHAGYVDELVAHVDRLEEDIVRLDHPPRPSTDLHQLRALLARHAGKLDDAVSHAHAALELAQQHGYRLLS